MFCIKFNLFLITLHWKVFNFGCSTPISSQVLDVEPPHVYLFRQALLGPEDECFDVDKNCTSKSHLCGNKFFVNQMAKDCAKTCKFCNGKSDSFQAVLPDIQTVNNTADLKIVRTSLFSKTIIKGTCFDEYIYCGEFVSLCEADDFRELMAKHCSLTCKRCEVQHKEREICQDILDCTGMSGLCNHTIYQQHVQLQCPKTCGVCKNDLDGCNDKHKNCNRFKRDGFCDNEIYTVEERNYLCGSTCGLCKK